MMLTCESSNLEEYLKELDTVDYSSSVIKKKKQELFHDQQSDIEKTKIAFEFVRDQISHSWDIQAQRITKKASEVLQYQHGICYAKSNLLAALLRAEGIPTGFCYQRLMLFETPEKGYCIHALNAVFLKSLNRWIRLDARGNKPGVNSEFSINEEKLAFHIKEEMVEKDYPTIYVKPNEKTMAVLEEQKNTINMYQYYLPDDI
ncbi:transglutaminase family protein [Bacillus sp. 03113]|uniref:transglutaminase-like domain-containing protein n=1 Tax=Bacillus sp. 03113 TaxID=2578211 RepID=UPI0011414BB7|nr:transglutaminase-like domain-containing protein [Bacillus sp. 03113]